MNTILKTTVRTFAYCIIAGLVLFSQAERVSAKNAKLYVDAAAYAGGDGSKDAPFRRITDAVNMGRLIWLAETKTKVQIQVESGIYVGSYSNTGPDIEVLPIILDIPGLKLEGSTAMFEDDDDLPTGVFKPGKNSQLIAQPALAANQVWFIVAATNPVLTGQGVEVSNLSIEVGNTTTPSTGAGISVRLVQDFRIRDNYVTGAFTGIEARGSSGEIRGNYVTLVGCGVCLNAGNATSPADVVVRGNRSVNTMFGGVLLNGGSTFSGEVFDSLSAVIKDNDLSYSSANSTQGTGIRILLLRHDPPSQATSGLITATISGNRISHNSFGFSIAGGLIYRTFAGIPDPRLFNGTLNLTFEDNEVVDNLLAPAIISFTQIPATLFPSQLNTGPTQFKYLEHSTFNITDAEGDLVGSWIDHPASDPIDGRILQNILRINGVDTPNLRYVPFP